MKSTRAAAQQEEKMSEQKLSEHNPLAEEKPLEYWRERWRLVHDSMPPHLRVPQVVLDSGDGLVAALETKLEAMVRLLSDKYIQWGWNGMLPMKFGFCYLCGRSHTEGHLITCDFVDIAAAQQEEKEDEMSPLPELGQSGLGPNV